MKKFKFTLEALRVLRQRQEREAMGTYAATLTRRANAAEALQEAEGELALAQHDWRKRLSESCNAVEMVHRQFYCVYLENVAQGCAETLAKAEKESNTALQKMLRAKQDREVVEKFFGHQRAAYDRELSREDQKFLDELAGRQAASVFATQTSREEL